MLRGHKDASVGKAVAADDASRVLRSKQEPERKETEGIALDEEIEQAEKTIANATAKQNELGALLERKQLEQKEIYVRIGSLTREHAKKQSAHTQSGSDRPFETLNGGVAEDSVDEDIEALEKAFLLADAKHAKAKLGYAEDWYNVMPFEIDCIKAELMIAQHEEHKARVILKSLILKKAGELIPEELTKKLAKLEDLQRKKSQNLDLYQTARKKMLGLLETAARKETKTKETLDSVKPRWLAVIKERQEQQAAKALAEEERKRLKVKLIVTTTPAAAPPVSSPIPVVTQPPTAPTIAPVSAPPPVQPPVPPTTIPRTSPVPVTSSTPPSPPRTEKPVATNTYVRAVLDAVTTDRVVMLTAAVATGVALGLLAAFAPAFAPTAAGFCALMASTFGIGLGVAAFSVGVGVVAAAVAAVLVYIALDVLLLLDLRKENRTVKRPNSSTRACNDTLNDPLSRDAAPRPLYRCGGVASPLPSSAGRTFSPRRRHVRPGFGDERSFLKCAEYMLT
jgi:hypothetical protein